MIIILFSLLLIINSQDCSVNLRYHRWCPNSAISYKIIEKLQEDPSLKNIQFNKYDEKQHNKFDFETFPTIWLQKNGEDLLIYENEHNLMQLKYWVNIYCLNQIPVCTQSLLKRKLPTLSANFTHYNSQTILKVIQMSIESPELRFCNSNNNISFEKLQTLYQIYKSYPLLFEQFNHNIRNHLIKSNKVGVFVISQNQSLLSNHFTNHYFRIIQLPFNNLTKNDSKSIWKLPKQDYKSLQFIKAGKNSKIKKKLLQFINVEQSKHLNMIVSIRFLQGNLYFNIYQGTVLDNRFTFWIHEQVSLGKHYKAKQEQYCIFDQVIYRYSPYNLREVLKKVQLQKMLTKSTVKLKSISKKFWNKQEQPGITLCRRNQYSALFTEVLEFQKHIQAQSSQQL